MKITHRLLRRFTDYDDLKVKVETLELELKNCNAFKERAESEVMELRKAGALKLHEVAELRERSMRLQKIEEAEGLRNR